MSDMRNELLTSAEGLIRRRGYSGFSYADLSERVGIRKASIHYHFPTKEGLIATVLQTYRDRYMGALQRIEENFGNALDRIDAYGRLYLTGVDKGLGCLCAALSSELEILPVDLRTGTVAFFREHLAWIEKVYQMGRQNAEVNASLDDLQAARIVVSSLEGALMMERLLDGSAGFEITMKAIRTSLSPPTLVNATGAG